MGLRLIVEKPQFEDQYEYILEEENRNAPSTLYIKGPYMSANYKNRNNRIYPIEEMKREVDRYVQELVSEGRAIGELNHPASADVDLERACHLVKEMSWDGNVVVGKSKVLSSPCGQITRCLINDGVKIGMSSRALGNLIQESGTNRVKDMRLIAIDCVADPSFPKAFVNGILESKQWVLQDDGKFEEVYDNFEKAISTLPKHDIEKYLMEKVINFIKSIK